MQQSFDPATRIMTLSFLVEDEGPLSASGKSMKVAGTNAGKEAPSMSICLMAATC